MNFNKKLSLFYCAQGGLIINNDFHVIKSFFLNYKIISINCILLTSCYLQTILVPHFLLTSQASPKMIVSLCNDGKLLLILVPCASLVNLDKLSSLCIFWESTLYSNIPYFWYLNESVVIRLVSSIPKLATVPRLPTVT